MADTFSMKRNDLLPDYEVTLEDANGPANLESADGVTFIMRKTTDDEDDLKVNAPGVIVNAEAGIVKYVWQFGDTDETGDYYAEFEVDIGGRPITFPNPGFNLIEIGADLDDDN